MSESNVPEIIKYLTEDNLKLMYSRLNRRYLVVDALPSVDSLEPADKNVIYVVKETVGETVRYCPNVLDNDAWKPFGIGQADLDSKADKVDAVEGNLVVSDGNGDLVDADIMPGTFVALAIDPSESIQPHATNLRKIWKAYQSGMPVSLLDNRPDGTGLYAQLNAAGYTWADGNRMAECLDDVDDDNRQCDGTIHGYCTESDGDVKFYEDKDHTVEIVPENGKLYCDDTVPDRDRVYRYNDGFVRALRFVQFSCNELIDDDPAWPSRRATRQVFYRMTEPYGSSSPDGFEIARGESTTDIHDQMVTGARIGEGKLLPVDDGVIVLPKSTAVNDGTLTITVGESEPLVFSANDSADRAVDIPVATDEVAGLVRITSDVDSDDPDAAITATAVLNELDSYVQKVDSATAGHIAVFTSEGSMSDSGISSTDVESAIRHDHTHDNKSILDEVTAPYTTEEQAKLEGIEAGAKVNVIESIKVGGTALPVTNKAVDIDMSGKADKVRGATGGNFAGLDTNGNLTDSGSKAADFATAEQGTKADAAYRKPDGGIPKSDLDSSVQASLGKADTALQEHQDISGKVDKVDGKSLSTNDFTDNDKDKLANIEARAEVNVIKSISIKNTALQISDKNVDIPIATSEEDGLLPKEKFPLIPAAPLDGADRIYSFDDTNGTSWQTIVQEYVGNMILDQQGTPVEDEEGEIMHDEDAVSLWLSYKGTEFGARRAYEDHTGQNINEALAAKTTMSQVNNAIETALANYGGFVVVNSLVDGHPDVASPSERFIYLYKDPQLSVTDPYTEWIYTSSHEWDVIGETTIDVSGKQDSLSALPSMAASKFLQTDANQNIVWGNLPQMSGATSSAAGTAGTVPAPTAGDQVKFLKGDGTWATPPEVNLASYYYDDCGNGLSAKRTSYSKPYGSTSLVGGNGHFNTYGISATFYIDWDGVARHFFTARTDDAGASCIGFGTNSSHASALRYLLPTPVSNKYAKTDANGKITWGDVPSLPSPSINDSLLLGQSDGSETWTALENDVFGTQLLDENDQPLLDEETGEPMYDSSSTDQLWTGFAGKGFGAIRAYADQDGNNIKATYATKSSVETVANAGMHDLGQKYETDLSDGVLAISRGNSNTKLKLTTVSTLTVLANSGVPNFALLVDNSENLNDVTLSVKTSDGVTTLYHSTAGGTSVGAGKIVQVTAVGNCWTIAEVEL